jgi:hypothetical protein
VRPWRLDILHVLLRMFSDVSAERTASNIYHEDARNTFLRKSVNLSDFPAFYGQKTFVMFTAVKNLVLKYSVAWCAINSTTQGPVCIKITHGTDKTHVRNLRRLLRVRWLFRAL